MSMYTHLPRYTYIYTHTYIHVYLYEYQEYGTILLVTIEVRAVPRRVSGFSQTRAVNVDPPTGSLQKAAGRRVDGDPTEKRLRL